VHGCPARTVHGTSWARRYELARDVRRLGRGGGPVRSRTPLAHPHLAAAPAPAPRPRAAPHPVLASELVPGCRTRSVHRTSSAPRYELAFGDGEGVAVAGARCGCLSTGTASCVLVHSRWWRAARCRGGVTTLVG